MAFDGTTNTTVTKALMVLTTAHLEWNKAPDGNTTTQKNNVAPDRFDLTTRRNNVLMAV